MAGLKLAASGLVAIFIGFGWNSMEVVGIGVVGLIGGILFFVISESSSSGTKTVYQKMCPSCNRYIPLDSIFCPYCEKNLKQIEETKISSLICPYCGKKLKSDDIICPNCGKNLNVKA